MADHEATITKLRQKVEEEEAQENGSEEVEEADFDDLVTENEAKSSTREYVVLVNTGQAWKELARAESSSPTSAIQSLGEKLEPKIEYVAVPVRSWKPASFEVETKTTFKLSSK